MEQRTLWLDNKGPMEQDVRDKKALIAGVRAFAEVQERKAKTHIARQERVAKENGHKRGMEVKAKYELTQAKENDKKQGKVLREKTAKTAEKEKEKVSKTVEKATETKEKAIERDHISDKLSINALKMVKLSRLSEKKFRQKMIEDSGQGYGPPSLGFNEKTSKQNVKVMDQDRRNIEFEEKKDKMEAKEVVRVAKEAERRSDAAITEQKLRSSERIRKAQEERKTALAEAKADEARARANMPAAAQAAEDSLRQGDADKVKKEAEGRLQAKQEREQICPLQPRQLRIR